MQTLSVKSSAHDLAKQINEIAQSKARAIKDAQPEEFLVRVIERLLSHELVDNELFNSMVLSIADELDVDFEGDNGVLLIGDDPDDDDECYDDFGL